MRFIELERFSSTVDGKAPMWVNADQIATFVPGKTDDGEGTKIRLITGKEFFTLTSPQDILNKIAAL